MPINAPWLPAREVARYDSLRERYMKAIVEAVSDGPKKSTYLRRSINPKNGIEAMAYQSAKDTLARAGKIERHGKGLTAITQLSSVRPSSPVDLGAALKDQRTGDWVVLNPDMTQVIGSGKTPEEALFAAGIIPVTSKADTVEPRPVLIQVPDPSVSYVYPIEASSVPLSS